MKHHLQDEIEFELKAQLGAAKDDMLLLQQRIEGNINDKLNSKDSNISYLKVDLQELARKLDALDKDINNELKQLLLRNNELHNKLALISDKSYVNRVMLSNQSFLDYEGRV